MVKPRQVTFYGYANCTTCKRAKRWLDAHRVRYSEVAIVDEPPSARELRRLIKLSGLPIKKWFNTSGQSYRRLVARVGKAAVAGLDNDQIVALLANDGKLIKRPVLVVGDDKVVVGFQEKTYETVAG